MMSDDFANELPRQPIGSKIFLGILLVLGALVAAAILLPSSPASRPDHSSVGKPFPDLRVEGWLNGPGPTAEELKGKVCIIEAWAYWCDPCLQAAPHLIELYHKYHDRGVVFFGLTHEGSNKLKESQAFLDRGKITWPNGYGAMETVSPLADETGNLSVPMMWVVNQQGIVVWAGDPLDLPEHVVNDLLK